MEKFNLNQDQEIIVTVSNLTDIISCLALLTGEMAIYQGKLSPEENARLAGIVMGTFVQIAKLFPQKDKQEIFKELKSQFGLDVNKILENI